MYPDLRVGLANTEIQRDEAREQLVLLQRQTIEALAGRASSESVAGELRAQLAKAQEQLTAAAQNEAYLLQEHGEDWARILELEADVRALAEALTLYVNNPSHYAPKYPFGWCAGISSKQAEKALALPAVAWVMAKKLGGNENE